MPAGLEVYRTNGTKRFGLQSRPVNLLGRIANTGIHNGSVTVAGWRGQAISVFPLPLGMFNEFVPVFTFSNGVISWTFKTSGYAGNLPHAAIYGEW